MAAGLATAEDLATRRDWWLGLLDLLRVRARTTNDIVRQAATYFNETVEYDPKAAARFWKDAPAVAEVLRATRDRLAATAWESAAMEDALRRLGEERGIPGGEIFQSLRVALTGVTASPGIFDVLAVLGRDTSLARLDAAVRHLTRPH